jgi:hypothetical protein
MLKLAGTFLRLACCAFALSSCVPTSASPTTSEWVYSAFLPTDLEINRACDLGHQAGSDKSQKTFSSVGVGRRTLQTGILSVYTSVGGSYTICYILATKNPSKPASVPKQNSSIYIEESSIDIKDTRVSLEFLNEAREVIEKVPSLSKKLSQTDASLLEFSLPEWSDLQTTKMKQSSSFAVIVVQGQAQQRFEFHREDFGGLL